MKKVKLMLFIMLCMLSFTSPILAEVDCSSLSDEKECRNMGCYWNTVKNESGESVGQCSKDLSYVTCGSTDGIPTFVPRLTSFAVSMIKYVVPIILIITSMISLTKAVTSGSADDASKVKSKIIKKFIAAFLVFLVVSITQFVVLKVADNTEKSDIRACFNCLLNNNCSANTTSGN